MGQVVYFGLCLLGCLLFNPSVEGTKNGTEVDARARCPPGALYYKQFCYQYHSSYINWNLAEIKCQELKIGPDVHLASILSKNEATMVLLFLKQHANSVWIGLQGTDGRGGKEWEWTDGSLFKSRLWDNNVPSSSSHECFALHNIQNSNSPKWQQRLCSDTLPYICKFKADY